MSMLIKNPTDPIFHREGEHIPSVTRRPVGYRKAGLMARDKPAYKEQEETASARKNGEAIKPR